MFTNVLVATDGSPGDDVAIDHATELADAYGASVQALYVVDVGPEPAGLDADQHETLYEPAERRGREATVRVENRASDRDLEVARAVREGVPHEEILAAAAEYDSDLIVVGTHGRTGVERARLGSTTERVLTRADVPVLSVRLDDDADPLPDDPYDRILLPTDGSDAAERAAESALDVAERYDADVHVVYVIDSSVTDLEDAPRSILGVLREAGESATEDVAELARERGLEASTEVRRGLPGDELLAATQSVDADLIAMGTRGRVIASGDLLGSTTARVVRRSPVPVLTVG
ncbi:universal stress protein [Natrarchaeobaculum aegyptiacum]|nr:universal stress protein [Natrarchaeobaculum aegyptiacum]